MDEELFSHRRTRFVFLFLVVINIFLLTANLSHYVRDIKNLIFYFLAPTTKTASSIIYSNWQLSENIRSIVKAHQENMILKKRLERYVQLENERVQAQDENERLRTLVEYSPFERRSIVVAKVLSRESGSWFQWIIINKGKDSGFFIDAPVFAWVEDKLCVLGRVGEIFDEYSKVVLITNNISALPAYISSSNEDGLLEGQDGPILRLNYMIPKKTAKIGSKIFTSAISSVFPPNMLIGEINDLIISEDEKFHSALVEPAVNLNNLREVVILVPKGKGNI